MPCGIRSSKPCLHFSIDPAYFIIKQNHQVTFRLKVKFHTKSVKLFTMHIPGDNDER